MSDLPLPAMLTCRFWPLPLQAPPPPPPPLLLLVVMSSLLSSMLWPVYMGLLKSPMRWDGRKISERGSCALGASNNLPTMAMDGRAANGPSTSHTHLNPQAFTTMGRSCHGYQNVGLGKPRHVLFSVVNSANI